MRLYEEMFEECVVIKPTKTADGAGGFTTIWTESEPFLATVMLTATVAARVAEREQVVNTYSVTTEDQTLRFHDIVKRLSDGALFRIMSEPVRTPKRAGFKFAKVTAEAWELTT